MAAIGMSILREIFTLRPAYRAKEDWTRLVKLTVKRFARGNIAAQTGRVLMPEEQARQREQIRSLAEKWEKRAARHKADSAAGRTAADESK